MLKYSLMFTVLAVCVSAYADGPPPAHVLVKPVLEQQFQSHQRVVGSLEAVSKANIAVREEGSVIAVHFQEGDVVKKGAKLVTFDDRRLKAQLTEAQASLSSAKSMVAQRAAELERAQSDLGMKQQAHDQNAISLKELLDAQREQQVAAARLQASKDAEQEALSRIDLLSVRLDDTVIVSPFDGVVVSKNVEPGEWFRPGDAIATLVSSGTIDVWFNVPERFMSAVQSAGETMDVFVQAYNQHVDAKSLVVIPEVNNQTRSFSLKAEIANADNQLKPGMSVYGWVPTGVESKQLAVDQDAVLSGQTGSYVIVASKQGEATVAVSVPVKELFKKGDLVVVESNQLHKGDQVVVEGNQRLMPGTPLIPTVKN